MLTRTLLFTVALAVFVVAAPSVTVAQSEAPPGCSHDEYTGDLVCGGKRSGGRRNPGTGPVTPTTVYPFREFWRPVLRAHPEGGQCVDTEMVRLGREPTYGEDLQSEMQFLRLMRSYPICPDAVLPTTTPAMEAASFLERVGLPTPQPRIEPGRLPVGFESFLETGAPTTQTFNTDTPFGPLTLTATADIFVDWDDPHDDVDGWEGPMAGEPGPYPDGAIRHVYQYHGLYEIAVRYEWTATWSIGDLGGVIEGVETSGSYPAPGFEAYSRQAVG
jgi:hypothetical protein